MNPGLAKLQDDEDLGRLKTTTAAPHGVITKTVDDVTFSVHNTLFAYGARSFSVWNANGGLVYDSGDDFERITAQELGENFNSNNDEQPSGDARSDDKGPEPEGVAIGQIGDKTFAFIGLERVGGIMIYDVTNPRKPVFCTYARDSRDFSVDFDKDNLTISPLPVTSVPRVSSSFLRQAALQEALFWSWPTKSAGPPASIRSSRSATHGGAPGW